MCDLVLTGGAQCSNPASLTVQVGNSPVLLHLCETCYERDRVPLQLHIDGAQYEQLQLQDYAVGEGGV